MTALAIAALALTQATSQAGTQEGAPARLTISTGLVSAERALAELAKATGFELRTTPALANLPLMVRVKDAEPRLILGKVAELLGAEWKQEGTAFVLSSDSAYRRKLAKIPDVRRTARIAAKIGELDAMTKDLRFDDAFAGRARKDREKLTADMMKSVTEGNADFNPMAMLSSPVVTQSPGSRAIHTILAGIGPANLAALPSGERVVYALNPTRMQGALPPNSRRALETFVADSAAYAQSMKNTASGNGMDIMTMLAGMGGKGQGQMADAHLELWLAEGMITAGLTIYDAKGQSLGQGFSLIQLGSGPAAPVQSGELLKVTELGREWGAKLNAASDSNPETRGGPMAMMGSFTGNRDRKADALARPMSSALKSLLADPVANSLGAPLFEPIASTVSGDLIATVPDSGLSVLARVVSDYQMTATGAMSNLEASSQFSVTRDGTLTLIGAASPVLLHREFANRQALKELVASIVRTGYLRLADAARYAVQQRDGAGASNLGSPLVTLFQGKAPFALAGDPLTAEFETLRIYGSLTEAQRGALAAGQGVPYTALSGEASDALARLLFNAPIGPMPMMDEEDADETGSGMEGMIMGFGSRANERTVRFANGVPREGFFTMTSSATDTYRMMDSTSGATMFGEASVLGMVRGAKEIPFLKNLIPAANYDRFTPAKNLSLDFKFVFGPKIAAHHSLEDYEVTSNASLTYDQLPQEFRDAAEESAKSAAAMKAPPRQARP